MATIKFGALVTSIKGKIGGTVLQGGKQGATMKNKPMRAFPFNTGKISKSDANKLFNPNRTIAEVSTNWKDLSDAERLSWSAAAPDFPFYNKYNEPYTGSGFQLYMSFNSSLIAANQNIIINPPLPSVLLNCPTFTITPNSPSSCKLGVSPSIDADYTLLLYGTVPMSPGAMSNRGNLKLFSRLDSSTSFPYNIVPDYENVFGNFTAGATVNFVGQYTKTADGRKGNPYQLIAIV